MLPPSNPHGSQYILPLYLSQCSHKAFTCLLQSWWPSSALHTSTTAHSPYLAHDHAPALLARPNNTCHGLQPARPSHLIASHQACQQDYVVVHVISNTSVEADLYSSSSMELFFFLFWDGSWHGTCNIRYDGNMYEISSSVKCKNREKIYTKEKQSHTRQYLRDSVICLRL